MDREPRPWLKSYDPDVPAEVSIPDVCLDQALTETFRRFETRPAFHCLGMSMTFGELLEASSRFARALGQRGVGRPDVVAVNLPNLPTYVVAVLGALRAGCAVSGLAPLLTADEMAYQLNDCGARVLVTLDSLLEGRFARVADQVPRVGTVLVAGAADFLPQAGAFPGARPLRGKEVRAFMDLLADGPGQAAGRERDPGDACFVQYTGGTTGPPKGAVLTHRNLVANLAMFEQWMRFERGRETWLSGFPMFHMAGLFVAMSALSTATAQVLVPDPRDLDHIIREIRAHRPQALCNVPSLYRMLLGQEAFRALDFSDLRTCLSGAAPFPADGIRALESVVGAGKLVEVWGMTETSPLITVNPARGRKKIGSVGLPLPGTRLRVVDLADGGTPLPPGREGELICSGPQVMKGYLNRPQETRNALREHDGALWMHTGDVGRMDEDGFVYVVDRAKDMIIVGGYKVFSSEVEDKLTGHPAVGMCALVGLPNPDRPDSEIVKLVVQKSPEARHTPDAQVEADLLAFAREKLAPYKVPRIVQFVEALPLTSVGKVNKKALRV